MRLNLSIFIYIVLAVVSFTHKSDASPVTSKKLLRAALFTGFAVLDSNGTQPLQQEIDLCCLCDRCGPPVTGREDLFVDANGKTCFDLVLEIADPNNDSTVGSSECLRLIDLHHLRCCDPSHNPEIIPQNPTTPPEQGDYPVCDICHDGSFPTRPNTLVAVLESYLPGGPFTCRELYNMGENGHISDQICNPLVDYVEEPCGCLITEPTTSPTENSDDEDEWDYPPKKDIPESADKDSAKLSQNDRTRGGIHKRFLRKSRIKGM